MAAIHGFSTMAYKFAATKLKDEMLSIIIYERLHRFYTRTGRKPKRIMLGPGAFRLLVGNNPDPKGPCFIMGIPVIKKNA